MKTVNRIGVYMDHSIAHIIELPADSADVKKLESHTIHRDEEHSIHQGDKMMHNKEKETESKFFKTLSEIIIKYKEVVLFGPTEAKTELYNILRADNHFADIKIDIQTTDKMTEGEVKTFVKDYFSIIY